MPPLTEQVPGGRPAPFVDAGDSGAVFYLIDDVAKSVRPFGLFHAIDHSRVQAMLTPLQVILDFLNKTRGGDWR